MPPPPTARRTQPTVPALPGLSSLPRAALKGPPLRNAGNRHVLLPDSAQTAPALPLPLPPPRRPVAQMTKTERGAAGYARLTAYCTGTGTNYTLGGLAAFLRREHGVPVKGYEGVVFAVYTLPLLPGYAGSVRVRSSALASDHLPDDHLAAEHLLGNPQPGSSSQQQSDNTQQAELIVFDYGVAVFYNFPGANAERRVLRDILEAAGSERRKRSTRFPTSKTRFWKTLFLKPHPPIALPPDSDSDDDSHHPEGGDEQGWEIESMHYEYDPQAESLTIINDFLIFKGRSHVMKLSIGHALAQSSKLAAFEKEAEQSLSSASMIPRDLALSGLIKLNRRDALHLTGDLFRLRVDVNLVSNILDTPDLFWSEAALKKVYDAAREYFEISERAKALNGRLDVTNDLLHIIHDKVSEQEMDRLTWIIIWLIIIACIVAVGEVIVSHASHFMYCERVQKMWLSKD